MNYITNLCTRCAANPRPRPTSGRPAGICRQCGAAGAPLQTVLVNAGTPRRPEEALTLVRRLQDVYSYPESWVSQLTLNDRDRYQARPTEDETPMEEALYHANNPSPAFQPILDQPGDVVTDLVARYHCHACQPTPYGQPCDVCFEDGDAWDQAEDLIFAGSYHDLKAALAAVETGLAALAA